MTTETTEPPADPASPLVTDKPVTRTKGSAHGRRKRERKRLAVLPDPPPTYQAKHGKFGSARAKQFRRLAKLTHPRDARMREQSYNQLRATWLSLDHKRRRRMVRQIASQFAKLQNPGPAPVKGAPVVAP